MGVGSCFFTWKPSWRLLVQSQQWKHQNNARNLFKVNNKDTNTTPLKSFWCSYCEIWTNFTHCSGVSIADFEQSLKELSYTADIVLVPLLLNSGSHLSKKLFYFRQWKPFKNEKCFLFPLKSFFHSQDIWIFLLIRKIKFISHFMMSLAG